jgi:galactose mutarotase-like enzyme
VAGSNLERVDRGLFRCADGVKMTKGSSVAAGIENVLISCGECAVTVLPQFGGKIASLRIGNKELLQQPLAPIAARTRTMAFDEGDASGWDECLPSVAECRVETEAGRAEIPDHGDLWRVEWERQGARERGDQGQGRVGEHDTSLTLTAKCFSLSLELTREVRLSATNHAWKLSLGYTVRNNGKHSVPWSWAAHPLFVAEEGDRIVLPESIHALRLEGSGGGRLGKKGDRVAWPVAKLADGGMADLSVAGWPDSGIGDKLFAGPLTMAENCCMLERGSAGLRIRVTFDAAATPYLGLWICYGGWPQRSGTKQVCVALEPATAPVDSLVETGPWSRELGPGESFSWPMEVEIERIER